MSQYVLTLSCPDRVGIVHAVAAYLHQAGCNVLDSQQFGDRTVEGSSQFFMRVHLESLEPDPASYDRRCGPASSRWRTSSAWSGSCTTPPSSPAC